MVRLTLSTFFILLFVLGVYGTDTAYAQETPDEEDLPELSPHEFEIRRQIEIELPSFERPALSGFQTPPRVVAIPERDVFKEDYKQLRSELPESPIGRPDPPTVSSLAGRQPINGDFEALAGRYFNRNVRARVGVPLTPRETFLGRVDYRGSDGHHPFDQRPDLRAPFDVLDGLIGFNTSRPTFSAGFAADGFAETYTLFGVRGGLLPYEDRISLDREGQRGGARIYLQSLGEDRANVGFSAAYHKSRVETLQPENLEVTIPFNGRRLNENRIDASFDLQVPVGSGSGVLDADLSTASLDGSLLENNVTLFNGAAYYRFLYRQAFTVTLGGRFLTYSVLDKQADSDDDTISEGSFFSPEVRVELYPAHGIRVYFQNIASADRNALADVFQKNPYLISEPSLQPTVRSVDAEGGVSLFIGPVQLTGHAGFQHVPNQLYFERATSAETGGYSIGFTGTRYNEARIMYAGGDLSIVLPAGLQATLGGRLRDGKLTEEDTVIPYYGAFVGHGMISYSFLQGKGLVQLMMNYESSRYNDRAETRKIGDFFDTDISASYYFTPGLGITGRIENLSSGYLERWENYPIAPTVLSAGVSVRW